MSETSIRRVVATDLHATLEILLARLIYKHNLSEAYLESLFNDTVLAESVVRMRDSGLKSEEVLERTRLVLSHLAARRNQLHVDNELIPKDDDS